MRQSLIGRKLGKYEITEFLGQGGMATVYKGYQVEIDRFVAIKVLPPHPAQDEQFAERFELEARTIARLQHPHILPIYDYSSEDDILYLAMAYVQGGSLNDRIMKGAMDLSEIEKLLHQVASALDYAHKQGVIHRDIKPDNILLNEEGFALLTDFGIAKLLEGNTHLTATGSIVGTPAYMAPEQGQGYPIDHTVDIYSLGVIVYEMLTGQQPYQADTPIQVVIKHISDPPPSITLARPGLPATLESIMLRVLAKNPKDRFQTATAFAQAFSRAIHDDESLAEFHSPPKNKQAETLLLDTTQVQNQPQTITTTAPNNNRLLLVGFTIIALLMVIAVLVIASIGRNPPAVVIDPTTAPTTAPAIAESTVDTFGRLTFATSETVGDTVNLTVEKFTPPPAGQRYIAWLQNPDGDQSLLLGTLSINALGDGLLTYTNSDGLPLPASFNQVIISAESDPGDEPSGEVRYSGSIPAAFGPAWREILVESEDGISGGSLLDGAMAEASIGERHAGLAAGATNVGGMHTHAEHTINILLGTDVDYNNNGRGENPGRGIGVIFFLDAIEERLDSAINMPGATRRLQSDGELVRVCLENTRTWVDQVVELEKEMLASDSLEASMSTATESTHIMNILINGTDLNQNNIIEPFEGECGLQQVEEFGVLFGGIDIVAGLQDGE
ncbi:MAG: serine/threonine protein kinase [Anaerolineae bacterium]|nr:serine/threonine protein kinase [Anaerolineae bacterium]